MNTRIAIRRISNLASYLKGDGILIKIKDGGLVADTGSASNTEIKKVAGAFFKKSYSL
jgi:hypothetical protein